MKKAAQHNGMRFSSSDVLNITQTLTLIVTLITTVSLAIWNNNSQAKHDSVEFMLKFDERIHNGEGAIIARALDREENLSDLHLDENHFEDALTDFFGNYELLNEAYESHLINKGMSTDAFQYDLERALNDKRARDYLADCLQEDKDLYSGVFSLAKDWELKFPKIIASNKSN